MFSFFKRKKERDLNKQFEELNIRLKNSFDYIKKDMHHVSSWISHFKNKHEDHDKQFRILLNRINRIENELEKLQNFAGSEPHENLEPEVRDLESDDEPQNFNTAWDSLTFTQQKILWKLAMLQKELPNQWISLKYLAQEMYPDKEYSAVRSTLSQFVTQLEEFGFLKRKRKGKLAYVCSTKKNPALKKKKKIMMELEE